MHCKYFVSAVSNSKSVESTQVFILRRTGITLLSEALISTAFTLSIEEHPMKCMGILFNDLLLKINVFKNQFDCIKQMIHVVITNIQKNWCINSRGQIFLFTQIRIDSNQSLSERKNFPGTNDVHKGDK